MKHEQHPDSGIPDLPNNYIDSVDVTLAYLPFAFSAIHVHEVQYSLGRQVVKKVL